MKRVNLLGLIAIFLLGTMNVVAQQLPINPNVKKGTLPNGLTYYIQHNAEPKERANFYIAQKVGSTLEEKDQLGLAHFLEHMAFNGLKHFPGKSMLEYLQAKGIRFGADINAMTGFDETIYNINNVTTTDAPLMYSVLLVLRDWSDGILLEDAEIEAERGVIHEEWRGSNTAQLRSIKRILPLAYEEYQYEQLPIGSMDVVLNFKPEVLRAYYKKWYRPDQQAIVVVGDFDAAEMEKKIIALFSDVVMPENAAERVYPKVSDNEKPIFIAVEDPETRFAMAQIMFKSDVMPVEMRNTIAGYAAKLAEQLLSLMINDRLAEETNKPDCPFVHASVDFGQYLVSKTKDAFNIIVVAKENNLTTAVESAMKIVAQACKAGFNDSEYQRAKDKLISQLEKLYNEREKTNNGKLAGEMISNFTNNEPMPGIEAEFALVKQFLPNFTLQILNQAAISILTPNNQVIIVQQPQKEGFVLPEEQVMTGIVNNTINAQYEMLVDEVVTEPMFNSLPKPGKIVSSKENTLYGTTELELSNGVKVIVKSTDFAADEVNLYALKKDGLNAVKGSVADVKLINTVFSSAKKGNFNQTMLRKYLAGKHVSSSYFIGNNSTAVRGSSSVKDMPVMFELTYAVFAGLQPDKEQYSTEIQSMRTILTNADKDPSTIFQRAFRKAMFNNPLAEDVTLKEIDEANFDKSFELLQHTVANAADYTFILVGNVDMEALKPLLEQYIATLPAGKPRVSDAPKILPVNGIVANEFKQPMANPIVSVFDEKHGQIDPSIENRIAVSLAGSILSDTYTATLREELGGAYSPGAFGSLSETGIWQLVSVFDTNSEMLGKMIERAELEIDKLVNGGADAARFKKAKEAAVKQYEINVRKNGYWMNGLISSLYGYDIITGHKQALDGMTLEKLNKFMKKNMSSCKNEIRVVMEGVKE